MLSNLIAKGHLPAELPPPFNSEGFSAFVSANLAKLKAPFTYGGKGPNFLSRLAPYALARPGTLRRQLAVPNPINYFHIAQVVSTNQRDLLRFVARNRSALSAPVAGSAGSSRALLWKNSYDLIPARRAAILPGNKYRLKADIKAFYPSIYTHSIPWALHTKKVAKSQREFADSVGNKLDRCIQLAQDGQTRGIPIGSDTSFLVAELILNAVDKEVTKRFRGRYFRFIDDYEIAAPTYRAAERAMSDLQEALSHFELQLNELKTSITDLPFALEPRWVREMREFRFGATEASQEKSIQEFFDLVLMHRAENQAEGVIKFGLARLQGMSLFRSNWVLLQQLVMSLGAAEPSALPAAIDLLLAYERAGLSVAREPMARFLSLCIDQSLDRKLDSEISSALWGHLVFKVPVEKSNAIRLCKYDNPFVALLFLDAHKKKLVSSAISLSMFESQMHDDELSGPNWLLVYEAAQKGWLPRKTPGKPYSSQPGFGALAAAKVSFYDERLSLSYTPKAKIGVETEYSPGLDVSAVDF